MSYRTPLPTTASKLNDYISADNRNESPCRRLRAASIKNSKKGSTDEPISLNRVKKGSKPTVMHPNVSDSIEILGVSRNNNN